MDAFGPQRTSISHFRVQKRSKLECLNACGQISIIRYIRSPHGVQKKKKKKREESSAYDERGQYLS